MVGSHNIAHSTQDEDRFLLFRMPLEALPLELIHRIFDVLHPYTIVTSVSQVCVSWQVGELHSFDSSIEKIMLHHPFSISSRRDFVELFVVVVALFRDHSTSFVLLDTCVAVSSSALGSLRCNVH